MFPGIVYVTVDEGTPIENHGTWIVLDLTTTCVCVLRVELFCIIDGFLF